MLVGYPRPSPVSIPSTIILHPFPPNKTISQPSENLPSYLLRSPLQLINNRLNMMRSINSTSPTSHPTRHPSSMPNRSRITLWRTPITRRRRRSCTPQIPQQRIHINLSRRLLLLLWLHSMVMRLGLRTSCCRRRRSCLGILLERGEQRLQGRVVELADHAGEVWGRGGGWLWWCDWSGGLRRVLIWVVGRRWCGFGGVRLVVVGGRVLLRRPGLGVMSARLGLFSQNELGGYGRVNTLVKFEADAAASGAHKDLDRDLALGLGGVV